MLAIRQPHAVSCDNRCRKIWWVLFKLMKPCYTTGSRSTKAPGSSLSDKPPSYSERLQGSHSHTDADEHEHQAAHLGDSGMGMASSRYGPHNFVRTQRLKGYYVTTKAGACTRCVLMPIVHHHHLEP